MNQHASPAFDDSRSQRHHKSHIGIYRIADQDLAMIKIRQIRMLLNDPRLSARQAWARRLPDQLSGPELKRLVGLFLIRASLFGAMIQIVENIF
jgi:hypothetical protein